MQNSSDGSIISANCRLTEAVLEVILLPEVEAPRTRVVAKLRF